MNRRKLGRRLEHYNSLMKNLSGSLIMHNSINTTISKAKELRRYVEKTITLAKKRQVDDGMALHFERMIRSRLHDTREVLDKLYSIANAMSDRSGGYTSIKKIGHRVNDNGVIANISIVKNKKNNSTTEQ
jgi:large subunit ribosomal protein L17